jgi:hypothetical protein
MQDAVRNFDWAPDETMRQYSPLRTDGEVMGRDGHFRDDGAL